MAKSTTLIILFLLLLMQSGYGQKNEAREKIEAARIALITDRLELSPEQAEKFWPLYNEYSDQKKDLARELQQARKGIDQGTMTEDESRQLIDKTLNIRDRQLSLERQYAKRMTEVITTQQLLNLKRAEEDFRKMILRRLEERKRQHMQREQMRNRREEIIKNRRNN